MKAAFAIWNEQLMTVAYGERWTMKAAFSTWENRIAPVFDVARNVRLVTDDSENVAQTEDLALPDLPLQLKVQFLAEQGVDLLVCGAISRPVQELIRSHRIGLMPFVSGPLEDVIEAWREGKLDETSFAMPGCCGRRHRRRRGRCGSRNR